MLFEYYGKVIVQPCRDLFSKALGLRVSQSSHTGFMSRVEAHAAMESSKQHQQLSASSSVTPASWGDGPSNLLSLIVRPSSSHLYRRSNFAPILQDEHSTYSTIGGYPSPHEVLQPTQEAKRFDFGAVAPLAAASPNEQLIRAQYKDLMHLNSSSRRCSGAHVVLLPLVRKLPDL